MRCIHKSRKTCPVKSPTWGPLPSSEAGKIYHYTPEQATHWLPWTARVLRMKTRAYEFPHNRGGGRVTFTGLDIMEISKQFAVRPISERKRSRRSKM